MITDNKTAIQNDHLLEKLRMDAEKEMRRTLDASRPHKKRKLHQGGSQQPRHHQPFLAVDRYRYSVISDLESGAPGFLITCSFRREKSATREACQLLARYLPTDLIPAVHIEEGATQQQRPQVQGQQGAVREEGQQGAVREEGQEIGPQAGTGAGTLKREGEETGAVRPCAEKQRGGQLPQEQHQEHQGQVQPHSSRLGEGDGEATGQVDASAAGDSSESEEEEEEEAGRREEEAGGGGGEGGQPSALALAKVGCRGVVLMRLAPSAAARVDPVAVVGALLRDIAAGAVKQPLHCQRIIPFDSTCALTSCALSRAVAQAATAHRRRLTPTPVRHDDDVSASGGSEGRENAAKDPAAAAAAPCTAGATSPPFTYAVVYRSRATELSGAAGGGAVHVAAESVAAQQPGESGGGGGGDGSAAAVTAAAGSDVLTERGAIISRVAAAMGEAFGSEALVGLKKPQVAVLVESVPVAGRQFGCVVLLESHMFVAKGKLMVKPLIKNAPS